ncbi:MAG: succinylglutamate desuccinylase/aspartoacylase family protein [Candidatus Bathyarchaeota archaeon]|nr:MAG: succinylglutamate desuccinylase/aspartoacylase family protein [Candidatus Bathyarchaeota archaeon]
MSEFLKVQNLEASRGEKKQGYLRISEKPAGPHMIPITLVNGDGDGPTVVINGGEHGSEYNGPAATLTVMKELDPGELSGRVIIAPVVNTLAFEARWMHGNPIDYRDMTGCYVEEIPRGGSGVPKISYQVATTFYKEVLSQGDYRLNLHGGDLEEDLLTGTMYRRTEDEKRSDENLALCRAFGYDWIRESLPRPGAPARRRLEFPMTVGTEAGGMGRCMSDIVEGVVKGIYNVLKHLGMLDGEPEIPSRARVYHPYHLYAEHGGFFISNVMAGDMVEEGDVVGIIKDLWGNTLEEIAVPTDGVIHMVTSPAIWEGDVVYEIGKDIREIE